MTNPFESTPGHREPNKARVREGALRALAYLDRVEDARGAEIQKEAALSPHSPEWIGLWRALHAARLVERTNDVRSYRSDIERWHITHRGRTALRQLWESAA
jgi:hypothetical protein